MFKMTIISQICTTWLKDYTKCSLLDRIHSNLKEIELNPMETVLNKMSSMEIGARIQPTLP